jgi:seryl-tRNA synthetase
VLDIKLIRENPDLVKKALRDRGEKAPLEEILRLDQQRRKLMAETEALQAEHNRQSKEIGRLMASGLHPGAGQLRVKLSQVSQRIEELEKEIEKGDALLHDLMLGLPNLPHPSVPVGHDEKDSPIIRSWGEPREFSFQPVAHWDLGPRLGIIDFERGTKLSGTRFYILRGAGSLLQRSLINFMLDLHTREHGYKEIYPPFMVRGYCMVGSGNLPKFGDNLYHDAEEDFWFVPTAEVPLTNLHRDEILEPGSLPIHYVAYTACFRREKMAAGRDTRGLKRGHQFDKVELYKFTVPESSDNELQKMVRDAEDVCQRLEIPYRIRQLCTGELGFASRESYDIEMWAPGMREWLEVSSCSNCGDFQARRASIRYRSAAGARPQFLHTLNGSGLALPRVLIALLENHQQPDGSVAVPTVLRPYMGGMAAIG